MKYKVFVSGNQKEMAKERLAVKIMVVGHQTLKRFFNIFIFEDVPAKGKSASSIYLKEVDNSDVYLGILGFNYGNKQKDGLSETEREYRRFINTKDKKRKENVLVFIKGLGKVDVKRDKEMQVFLKSIKNPHTYKRFQDKKDFEIRVRDALLAYLDDKGDIIHGEFDELICKTASYSDISEQEVRDFLENRAKKRQISGPKISVKDLLLKTLKVIRPIDGKLKPTCAGILFFGKNPSDFVSQNQIRIVRFKGNVRGELIDSKEIKGSLYRMLDEVELFFIRNTRVASKIVGFKRIDIPEYPFEAIREALVNAVAHRDYFRNAPIMVSIFDDRVEISSPGGLLPGLNLTKLEGHHESRNRRICDIFHETKDMEKFGTGICRMKRFMRDYRLPEPVFYEEGDFFVVKFYGPQDKILDSILDVPLERQTDLRKLGLNERQIKALEHMLNEKQKLTIKEYAALFNMSDKTAKRDMAILAKSGLVVKVGYKKGAYFKSR